MLFLLACASPGPASVWTDRALAWSTFPREDDDYEPIVGAPGDYDGDGEIDLMVMFGEDWEERQLHLVPGTLSGGIEASPIRTDRAQVGAPGDATGDGVADLVVAAAGAEEAVLLPGPLGDTLDPRAGLPIDGTGDTLFSSATACDVDGDGVAELLAFGGKGRIYDAGGTTLATLDGTGSGQAPFAECLGGGVRLGSRVYADPLGGSEGLRAGDWTGLVHWGAGDLDGDGADDVLVPGDGEVELVPGPIEGLSGTPIGDDCWANVGQVAGPVDLDQDGVDDLLVARAKDKDQGECAWSGAGRLEVYRGPITGPIGEPDATLEGEDVHESCHEEGGALGEITVCDAVVSDGTGVPVASGLPSFGVLPDLDGDGRPELWLVTLTDYHERTVWVIRGAALGG